MKKRERNHHGGYVKVGVLSTTSKRSDGGPTNAYIGAMHEFGSPSRNIPARSWLEMPLIHEKETIVEEVASAEASHEFLKSGDFRKFLMLLGLSAVKAIHLAFETGGFGDWKPLKVETIARKKRKGSSYPDSILVDTASLAKSVAYEVIT
ncbi:MAG: hypothetical protein KGJ13_04695 [Patescibacteria group bacterium]|nr:hypothetical protein [Patescibacteria group bacterium]